MLTDNEILEHAKKISIGMSKNQINNFVIKSHVTDARQLKQTLVEIENRVHNEKKIKIDRQKTVVNIARLERSKKSTEDEFDLEEIDLDLESLQLDLEMWDRKLVQLKYELNVFLDYVKENLEDLNDLEKSSEWSEEDERKYWIARLGKQAALDIIANGRVGIGNLDSIAMMKQEDQIATLDVASQYSCLMKLSMDKITGKTAKYFQAYADSEDINIPTFHGIEDSMNIPLLDQIRNDINEKYLQSSD